MTHEIPSEICENEVSFSEDENSDTDESDSQGEDDDLSESEESEIDDSSKTNCPKAPLLGTILFPNPKRHSLLIESILSLCVFMLSHSVTMMYCRPCETIFNTRTDSTDFTTTDTIPTGTSFQGFNEMGILNSNGFVNDALPNLEKASMSAHEEVISSLETMGAFVYQNDFGQTRINYAKNRSLIPP